MTIYEIQQAILQGKESLNGIKLPKPQKAGTFYQQKSYARMMAEKIYEKENI